MWIKYLLIIILFYLFAILQTSFFIYFTLFGSVPNLIFILFFILIFFSNKNSYYSAIFFAILAGLFLDIFSVSNLGISIIVLTAIGLIVKKILSLLKEQNEDYPFVYFFVLFLSSLIIYNLLLQNFTIRLNLTFLPEIIYNSIIAILGFWICKKFCKQNNVRQKIQN